MKHTITMIALFPVFLAFVGFAIGQSATPEVPADTTAKTVNAGPTIPKSIDISPLRDLVVQSSGRYPPLDTVARNYVWRITGTETFRGHDAITILLSWTFNPAIWMDEPLIKIGSKELRGLLELPLDERVFSYNKLINHPKFLELHRERMQHRGEKQSNPLHNKIDEMSEKLVTLQSIFENRVIAPIPNSNDARGTWFRIALRSNEGAAFPGSPEDAWMKMRDAFLADDNTKFQVQTAQLKQGIGRFGGVYRPSPERIATELRFNKIQPFRTAWILMVAGAILSAIACSVRKGWFDFVAVLGLIAGFGVLSYGLYMRWQIAGHIPASNMYESLLFLSWGMGFFAISAMLFIRNRTVPLTASALGAVSLMLADILPMNSFIKPTPPVLLDTIWMSIHVPIIMVSYSVLALAMLIAHAQLFIMAFNPGAKKLIRSVDSFHYWYVHVGSLLLLVGIITGSMWAASSWGRYWGWDPKEVWSLIAFMAYMCVLHVRIDREKTPTWIYVLSILIGVSVFALSMHYLFTPMGGLSPQAMGIVAMVAIVVILFIVAEGPFATAVKSIAAFWMIVMTYVGVNYVLGIGMHSYGFGTGAVARYMLIIGIVEFALVFVLAIVYGIRMLMQPNTPKPARASSSQV